MPAGLSPFGKAVLTSSFYFFYISYVTLPSVERREEWYVRRFELREFFFSDCSSTGLPPLGPSAGTFFTFFFSLFVPLTGFFRVFRLILPFLFTSCCCDDPRSAPRPLVRFRRSDPSVVFFFFWCVPGAREVASSFAFVVGLLSRCLFVSFFSFFLLFSCASPPADSFFLSLFFI